MSNEFEEMINKYFDDELTQNQEVALFTMLARDTEAIEYFKQMNLLRSSVEKIKADFPDSLDEKIFRSLPAKEAKQGMPKQQRLLLAGSYTIAAILLFVSVFLFNSLNNYKQEADNAVKEIKIKSQMIDFILNNTLPAAEVKAKNASEIIIKAN